MGLKSFSLFNFFITYLRLMVSRRLKKTGAKSHKGIKQFKLEIFENKKFY